MENPTPTMLGATPIKTCCVWAGLCKRLVTQLTNTPSLWMPEPSEAVHRVGNDHISLNDVTGSILNPKTEMGLGWILRTETG